MKYSIEFSGRLIEAADALFAENKDNPKDESGRTILYLSLLSCEISMKATLEKAGFTEKQLRKRSHKLHLLLSDFSFCYFPDSEERRATEIRAITINPKLPLTTVGSILTEQASKASVYPNEIRYGDNLKHFSPEVILDCAKAVWTWCENNFSDIKRQPRNAQK